MNLNKNMEDWLYKDHSGVLMFVERNFDEVNSRNQKGLNKSLLRVRGRELVLQELSEAIEHQKTLGFATAEFVDYVRFLMDEQSHPFTMRQDNKASNQLNTLIDVCPAISESGIITLNWMKKRPAKMMRFKAVLSYIEQLNVSLDVKWRFILIEHQRIMAQRLLMEARQRVVTLGRELSDVMDIPQYPMKPDCIEYL
ncbi:hypothetical protein DFR44_13030 [Hydromonas duriensis]|uniref:Uncharacterized protein n=2 Tax=Hydromonas duriensis TaxID=1527608 RepID=A0A4V3DJN0_9BURK|nr:hypothetical protein DFR44_13030 [Hydromonas duriensis]